MKNRAIPRLRFKGFNNKWNLSKIKRLINVKSGMSQKRVKEPNGRFPVIATSGVISKSSKPIYNGPSIILGRKGTINQPQYIAKPFWATDTTFYTTNSKSNVYFMYCLFNTINWLKYNTSTSLPSLTSSTINNIRVKTPSLTEQQLIGKFFAKLDKLIQSQQKKVSLLKKLKRGYLQKLFPRKGESVPRLRFKGFHDKWEFITLGKLADISTGSLNANAMVRNGKYNFYTSGVKVYKINNYKFDCNAITIAGNGASVGYMHLASGKFNAYQRTYVLYNIKPNREYLFCIIHNLMPRLIHRHRRAGNVPYIVIGMLKNLMILIPTAIEQNKIGDFFINLTKLINCQNYKLIQLRKLKKAYLQKMFC